MQIYNYIRFIYPCYAEYYANFCFTNGRITKLSRLHGRLLRAEEGYLWWRRVEVEVEKQESNPDINLTNRILSLSVAALERLPRSHLLLDQLLRVTQVYNNSYLLT